MKRALRPIIAPSMVEDGTPICLEALLRLRGIDVKRYNPGASIHSDYCYICDCCEKDDGRPILFWEDLPDRKGHFVLCLSCIKKLYIEHISNIDKKHEIIIVKRRVIPEKLRNKIFERNNNQCVKCKSKNNLQIDHIIPFVAGGMTTEDNLQTLCKTCNLSKRDG